MGVEAGKEGCVSHTTLSVKWKDSTDTVKSVLCRGEA